MPVRTSDIDLTARPPRQTTYPLTHPQVALLASMQVRRWYSRDQLAVTKNTLNGLLRRRLLEERHLGGGVSEYRRVK